MIIPFLNHTIATSYWSLPQRICFSSSPRIHNSHRAFDIPCRLRHDLTSWQDVSNTEYSQEWWVIITHPIGHHDLILTLLHNHSGTDTPLKPIVLALATLSWFTFRISKEWVSNISRMPGTQQCWALICLYLLARHVDDFLFIHLAGNIASIIPANIHSQDISATYNSQ